MTSKLEIVLAKNVEKRRLINTEVDCSEFVCAYSDELRKIFFEFFALSSKFFFIELLQTTMSSDSTQLSEEKALIVINFYLKEEDSIINSSEDYKKVVDEVRAYSSESLLYVCSEDQCCNVMTCLNHELIKTRYRIGDAHGREAGLIEELKKQYSKEEIRKMLVFNRNKIL